MSCHEYFHQIGFRAWVASFLLFPATLLGAILATALASIQSALPSLALEAFAFVLALSIEGALLIVYVNRRYPLAAGPKYG